MSDQVTGATTSSAVPQLILTRNKKTTANLTTDWEIHQKKSGINETPGQAFTIEWGLGQLLPLDRKMTKLLQLGASRTSRTFNEFRARTVCAPQKIPVHCRQQVCV